MAKGGSLGWKGDKDNLIQQEGERTVSITMGPDCGCQGLGKRGRESGGVAMKEQPEGPRGEGSFCFLTLQGQYSGSDTAPENRGCDQWGNGTTHEDLCVTSYTARE